MYEVKLIEEVLVSVPEQLAMRLRAVIPSHQRSKVIAYLIEKEVDKREKTLYECVREVQKDHALHEEMKAWDVTLKDGLLAL